jgi:undecaprenyl-diphosphatase
MQLPLWQALFLGALQGVSELFPISSLAHTILIPALLHWDLSQPGYLAFVVALHLATAIALVLYFWRDWMKVVRGLLGCLVKGRLIYDKESKFAWLLVVGTLFVGLAGLALEKKIRALFEQPKFIWLSAAFLIANGGVMMFGDVMKRRAARHSPMESEHDVPAMDMHIAAAFAPTNPKPKHSKHAEDLTLWQGFWVGAAQSLALLSGISRSGVTIVAGLFAGLTYEEACRFSFMLATPVIMLAAAKKVPELFKPEAKEMLNVTVPAAAVAGVAAFISTAFLMRYFRHNRLTPFGIYCIIFGGFALYMLKLHH